MELLLILGLGGWVLLQSQRIGALTRKLEELERRLAARPDPGAEATPLLLDTPAPAEEPLVLDMPLPANYEEPLLLDTPIPDASNDIEAEPARVLTRPSVFMPRSNLEPREHTPKATDLTFDPSHSRLTWLGGGAFALVAIYLAALAAAPDWFTPTAQLWGAVALGLVLLVVSEIARRLSPTLPQVATLIAGAGVIALYAAAWAAHGAFGFIEFPTAAAFLTICAALLIALAYVHGQALGVLAIAMALLTPAITDARAWPPSGLMLFVCALSGAGLALAALRRWAWVAAAATAGLYVWFADAIANDEIRRALVLLSFASLGAISLALRPPLEINEKGYLPWSRLHEHLPAIVISVSSVFLIWVWLATSPAPAGLIAGPAWVGAIFVALAAAAVHMRAAPTATFVVAVGALVAGFMAYLQSRYRFGPQGADFYPFVLFSFTVVIASAIGAQPDRSGRNVVAGTGAIGAGLLAVLAAFSRENWHAVQAWAPLFMGAAVLFGAAMYAAGETATPQADRAISFWSGAGAVLVILGVESAFPEPARSAAHAGAALFFAGASAWPGWSRLRFAAFAAAAIGVGHALSPTLTDPVLAGAIPLWGALTVLAGTAALLFSAGYFANRAAHHTTAEALDSAAATTLLISAFIALSWFAAGASASPRLDALSEHGARALILLCAGHIVMARTSNNGGFISRWRGHALCGAGVLYAFWQPGLMANPWWSGSSPLVVGAPIFNSLLLAFAAPAALTLYAAQRAYATERLPAQMYAIAGGVLTLMWALLEIRHLFHGADIAAPPIGVLEGACYALVFIGAALTVAWIARTYKLALPPDPGDLLQIKSNGRREKRHDHRQKTS